MLWDRCHLPFRRSASETCPDFLALALQKAGIPQVQSWALGTQLQGQMLWGTVAYPGGTPALNEQQINDDTAWRCLHCCPPQALVTRPLGQRSQHPGCCLTFHPHTALKGRRTPALQTV